MSGLLHRRLVRIALILLAAAAVTGPPLFIYSGVYDVSATRPHTPPVYWALITTSRRSIQAHAAREAPEPPNLADPELVERGIVLYDSLCVVCHGAPGIAPGPVGLGLTPMPSNLALRGRDRTAREIYWTITNGLKMTGMPAWQYRLTEGERWAIVALVKALPMLAPAEYHARRARVKPRAGGAGQP
jgi:mono/diheme cytochrome c family protein